MCAVYLLVHIHGERGDLYINTIRIPHHRLPSEYAMGVVYMHHVNINVCVYVCDSRHFVTDDIPSTFVYSFSQFIWTADAKQPTTFGTKIRTFRHNQKSIAFEIYALRNSHTTTTTTTITRSFVSLSCQKIHRKKNVRNHLSRALSIN